MELDQKKQKVEFWTQNTRLNICYYRSKYIKLYKSICTSDPSKEAHKHWDTG